MRNKILSHNIHGPSTSREFAKKENDNQNAVNENQHNLKHIQLEARKEILKKTIKWKSR